LLDTSDRQNEIARLLAQRYEAYAAIPRQIDTTALTTDEVAERVIEQAFSTLLPVRHPGGSYPIHVAEGLLDRLGPLVRSVSQGERITVVSNATVAPHYRAPVLASLRAAGWSPFVCTIPDGERHKTLDTAASLYAQFVQEGLDRSGIVLALGGGVVCDMAGFVAATYMRGVPVVQVPTSLLAMVDASVGGKTGVDLPQGKNLVGAFKQPELVAIDPAVLDTLPPKEIASGMAELIKHAVIADRELFDEMQASIIDQSWARRIARSLQVKIDVVEQDPYERGWRAVLNLGHTVGHALEQVSNYRLRHGESVSIGMVAAARISAAMGLSEPSVAQRLAVLLSAHDLPVACPAFDPEKVWTAVGRDKKKRGKALRWVLPRQIGQVEIVENVPREVVLDTLARMTTSERSEQG
jgi:3-dehydroquinate synthase